MGGRKGDWMGTNVGCGKKGENRDREEVFVVEEECLKLSTAVSFAVQTDPWQLEVRFKEVLRSM